MANIKTYLDKIASAIYGKDVRSSIHDGMDAINKEVESTTALADDISEKFGIIIEGGGDTNAEVIFARGSYSKLGDRLDASDTKVEGCESRITALETTPSGAKIEKYDVNVKASSYTLSNGVYSQYIYITGMTADYNPFVNVVLDTTNQATRKAQAEAYGKISTIITASGRIQIICDSTPTAQDITLHLEVIH